VSPAAGPARGGPGRPTARDTPVLVSRGARAGALLGAVGGVVSTVLLVVAGDTQGWPLLLAAAVALSAAVGGATGALGGRLVGAQVESGNGVRALPVVVVAALVGAVLALLVSALLGQWWAGPALVGPGAVLALVRVAGLARAAA
jgi:hypothetical protein